MGCRAEHYGPFLRAVFTLENLRGALITMPHKVSTVALLDEASPAVHIAGACNTVRRDEGGRLVGDLFDGEGFVRGLLRKGFVVHGADALVVGAGGVGSAIAASLVAAGVGSLGLFDAQHASAEALATRLKAYHPGLRVRTGSNDPAGLGLVVNATPLGMNAGDPLPIRPEATPGAVAALDLVYRPGETAWVLAQRKAGRRAADGREVLLAQGAAALTRWFPRQTPPLDVMRAALHAALD